MHGGAVALAEQFMAQKEQPDLILTTDMLDTATFLALTRKRSAGIPVAIYFHENQLSYPWSPTDEDVVLQRDRHYGWLNYTSALAADVLFFNSQYHQDSFLQALPSFLNAFPDYKGLDTINEINQKAKVLPLGMNLAAYDHISNNKLHQQPVLLWNHRWEYDKNPAAFFEICQALSARQLSFGLVVLGEQYAKAPAVFAKARQQLAQHILHWGYVKDFATYAHWLKQANFLPVTSKQDFFGGSVVEAIYCGAYPLLPRRLAFPEHLPAPHQAQHLYNTDEELLERLADLLQRPDYNTLAPPLLKDRVAHYDWRFLVEQYDKEMYGIVD
jgi:glycosyltransferase involved in cell wall biosynthesis